MGRLIRSGGQRVASVRVSSFEGTSELTVGRFNSSPSLSPLNSQLAFLDYYLDSPSSPNITNMAYIRIGYRY